MSRRPIRLYGDPVLQTKTSPVGEITAETRTLVADMFETMEAAKGVGLAANQVGVLERLFIIRVPGERDEDPPFRAVLINPEIVSKSGQQTGEEGCLSFPKLYFDVRRASRIMAKALDLDGKAFEIEAEGYLARAILHEIDHIDGVLFIDRISSVKRGLLRNKLNEIRARGAAGETRMDDFEEDE